MFFSHFITFVHSSCRTVPSRFWPISPWYAGVVLFRLFRTRLDRLTTWAQSLDELAKTASKRKALVDRTPLLLSLPSKIRNFCHDGTVSVRFAMSALPGKRTSAEAPTMSAKWQNQTSLIQTISEFSWPHHLACPPSANGGHSAIHSITWWSTLMVDSLLWIVPI